MDMPSIELQQQIRFDAKAASNTKLKTIEDTASHYKGRNGIDWLCAYLDGYLAPHYPMPAIRLAVDICETWDKTVVIFDLDKNDIVYGVYEGDFN